MRPSRNMTTRFITALFLLGITGLLLVMFGCASHPAPVIHSTPSAPVVASQEGKDAVVVAEAFKIDAIAPAAKEHTDAQRAAVASAPASQVKAILTEKDATISAQSHHIGALTEKLAKAEDKFSATLRWILTGGGALVMAIGVGSLFLMGQLAAVFPSIGPRISISIAAIGATLFASGIAYAWAERHQTAVGCILGGLALAALVYWHANRLHAASPAYSPKTTTP